MEKIEITNNKTNNIKKFDDYIFSVIKNDSGLDQLSEWVCDKEQISKIINKDDLKMRWLRFWDILKLSWYFWDLKDISALILENNVEWIYKISIESKEFEQLKVHIELCNNEIKIDMIKINQYMANNSIGTKYITNLIYFSKMFWFNKIYCTAIKPKTKDLGKKYKNKWYFFFPKLWFLISEWDNHNPKIMKKIRNNSRFSDVNSLNELLLTKDDDWNRIWLDFWKKIWESSLMEFDLKEWSESMKILEWYLKSKELPEN